MGIIVQIRLLKRGPTSKVLGFKFMMQMQMQMQSIPHLIVSCRPAKDFQCRQNNLFYLLMGGGSSVEEMPTFGLKFHHKLIYAASLNQVLVNKQCFLQRKGDNTMQLSSGKYYNIDLKIKHTIALQAAG